MTRRTRRLLWAAFTLSLLVIGGALVLPLYDSEALSTQHPGVVRHFTQTLVEVNGLHGLFVVVVPLLVTCLMAVLLDVRERRASDVAHCAAVVLVTLFAFANLLALFSAGLLVIPVTAMLVMAVRRPGARLAPAGLQTPL
ncbi:MAG TPA: hypothetical protein VKS25_07480 [Solirubrobacteraceae bacterium]|nr:hypothetical protein [Solirubrobacteraceae bacterium]